MTNTTDNEITTFNGASVLLDIADDGDLEAWAKSFGQITMERVVDVGPAGGWPVYRFVGPAEDIRALVNDYEHPEND